MGCISTHEEDVLSLVRTGGMIVHTPKSTVRNTNIMNARNKLILLASPTSPISNIIKKSNKISPASPSLILKSPIKIASPSLILKRPFKVLPELILKRPYKVLPTSPSSTILKIPLLINIERNIAINNASNKYTISVDVVSPELVDRIIMQDNVTNPLIIDKTNDIIPKSISNPDNLHIHVNANSLCIPDNDTPNANKKKTVSPSGCMLSYRQKERPLTPFKMFNHNLVLVKS
jgi:hypothetical protein